MGGFGRGIVAQRPAQLVWGFQLVHHDLWDYDTAAQPVLATLRRNGAETPVVIAGNKTGNLFVLGSRNRKTGLWRRRAPGTQE